LKKLSFYEQVGIVIPGSVLLFGLLFYLPQIREVVAKDGVSVGGLGIFVLIAYAAGHLVAALGNAVETALWRAQGGMPSDWVTKAPPNIISKEQLATLSSRVQSRFGIKLKPFEELHQNEWRPISRQIYADVMKNGKPQRIDTFNGNYGLNRGLCAATLALGVLYLIAKDWVVAVGLLCVSATYLYRAQRFGVHYAREMYVQFLLLPGTSAASRKLPPGKKSGAKDA